jgi:hypothetical protein
MAYIGRGIENLVNTQKLDAITPSTSTGAGPYNLTQNSVAFVPASADSLVISIDGVIQYGNFTVSGSTVTFSAALSDSNTCDFIYQMGTGLLTTPTDGSVNTAQLADNAVTTAKILDANITDAKVNTLSASKLTGALPAISGANLTNLPAETKPTISSISPTVIENTQTSITITGTNYVNGANVEAVGTNGAIIQADTVTFNSATSISAAFTITTDATYFLRIENPDGNAVRSSSALLTVSDAPAWTTSAGSLGSNAAGSSVSYTVAATGATTFAVQSGSLPGGVSLNTSTGVISGTESGATAETTYNFTIRASDAEGQTADRAFSITITVGINNSGQFN